MKPDPRAMSKADLTVEVKAYWEWSELVQKFLETLVDNEKAKVLIKEKP